MVNRRIRPCVLKRVIYIPLKCDIHFWKNVLQSHIFVTNITKNHNRCKQYHYMKTIVIKLWFKTNASITARWTMFLVCHCGGHRIFIFFHVKIKISFLERVGHKCKGGNSVKKIIYLPIIGFLWGHVYRRSMRESQKFSFFEVLVYKLLSVSIHLNGISWTNMRFY